MSVAYQIGLLLLPWEVAMSPRKCSPKQIAKAIYYSYMHCYCIAAVVVALSVGNIGKITVLIFLLQTYVPPGN